MKNEQFVRIPMDIYIDMLDDRRKQIEEWFQWGIPDMVWNYFVEKVKELGCYLHPENTDPKKIVDNLAVNGSYPLYEDCKEEGETDEEFENRVKDKVETFLKDDDGEKRVVYTLYSI